MRRLRWPSLLFVSVVLLHVALSPAAVPDCHDAGHASHSSHSHAVCHCPCCQYGEVSAADDGSFTAAPGSRLAAAPNLLRGRDVIFRLFRPPQPVPDSPA